jgi:membrane-bound ClpP family serine protease
VLATAVLDDAAAWLGLPLAFVVTGLGLGLLVERALGLRLQSTAVLPLGVCANICVLLAIYELGGHGWLAAALLLMLAGAGLLVARHDLITRFKPGAAAAAALAVGALYLAPAVLTGDWTWTGYNFLNDTAVQFLLAD